GLRNDAPIELELDRAHAAARRQAEGALAAAEAQPLVTRERLATIYRDIAAHWSRSGYDGDYDRWIERVTPTGEER
ncbi:MAG: hypothetical protein JWN04_2304, partial [Myxococcaceae bacterium]|nr:hypothetical protein [Myxococcaceae bacterium]